MIWNQKRFGLSVSLRCGGWLYYSKCAVKEYLMLYLLKLSDYSIESTGFVRCIYRKNAPFSQNAMISVLSNPSFKQMCDKLRKTCINQWEDVMNSNALIRWNDVNHVWASQLMYLTTDETELHHHQNRELGKTFLREWCSVQSSGRKISDRETGGLSWKNTVLRDSLSACRSAALTQIAQEPKQ